MYFFLSIDLVEVYVWLVSRIGQPINIPSNIAVQVIPKGNSKEDEIVKKVSRILEETLSESYLSEFINRLIEGKVKVC